MSLDQHQLGEVLDTLHDVRWHIELMELATRYDPGDEAKAFSAVIYTTLQKLEDARSKLEGLCCSEEREA